MRQQPIGSWRWGAIFILVKPRQTSLKPQGNPFGSGQGGPIEARPKMRLFNGLGLPLLLFRMAGWQLSVTAESWIHAGHAGLGRRPEVDHPEEQAALLRHSGDPAQAP